MQLEIYLVGGLPILYAFFTPFYVQLSYSSTLTRAITRSYKNCNGNRQSVLWTKAVNGMYEGLTLYHYNRKWTYQQTYYVMCTDSTGLFNQELMWGDDNNWHTLGG